MREPSFSLKDFTKWLEDHPSSKIIVSDNRLVPGEQVLVRLSEKNMVKKLVELNGDKQFDVIYEVAKNLRENGGVLKEIKGPNALIKTKGSDDQVEEVYIQRLFLRRPKKD